MKHNLNIMGMTINKEHSFCHLQCQNLKSKVFLFLRINVSATHVQYFSFTAFIDKRVPNYN